MVVVLQARASLVILVISVAFVERIECKGQARFNTIMCNSHMSIDIILEWCTETCQWASISVRTAPFSRASGENRSVLTSISVRTAPFSRASRENRSVLTRIP